MQIPHIVAPENQVRGAGDPAAFVVDPADPEAWRAQIFRSIDSDSAEGLPMGHEASALGLDSGKGKVKKNPLHRLRVQPSSSAVRRLICPSAHRRIGSGHPCLAQAYRMGPDEVAW